MIQTFKMAVRCIFIFLTHFSLTACAIGQPKYFFHSFNFDVLQDTKVYGHSDIDVLNYEYGSSGQFIIRPNKQDWEMLAQQGIDSFRGNSITGMMPRGEYLYVKWRVKTTGAVYEDTVDLAKRLPADITDYEIHFAVYGTQLYVYAFPPFKSKNSLGQTIVHGGQPPVGKRGETLLDIPYAREHQIYPDVQK